MTSTATNLVSLNISSPKYKIGDKVTLKSGGSPVTVTYCDGMYVTVNWFRRGALQTATFPVQAVRKTHTKERRYASVQG